MNQTEAINVFESLSSGVRLDIYRLLVRHAPQGMVAGEIAESLDLPPSNLSFHLKALTHTGLIAVTQEGRFLRYRAQLDMMQSLIDYLTEECCEGHPEDCDGLSIKSLQSDSNKQSKQRQDL
ncbi:MAG: helix-turn-helix domain-containing protein [Pseudohongiella sp.]|uniref:ArsR/SmtB family transcription factor n=1 Tax=Pseudohongiella sp. TaxID=1979412 RepID=UPI0034A09F1F